jgi:hypothetical protein
MSYDIIDDNIKIINNAFNVGDIDIITTFINSPFVQHLLNIDNNYEERNRFIEGCIKNTNIMVADMIINSIYIDDIKESVIDYIIVMYFLYNKYETALTIMSNYQYNISNVFLEIQELKINNEILINLFTKHNDIIFNSHKSQKNIMTLIGKHNNMELLHHIEKYYKLIDTDIESILIGSICNKNCFNIVRNIFENYNFDYNTNFFFFIIKELYYMHYDEIIDYVFNKLMIKSKYDAVYDIIYFLNEEKEILFIEYIINFITMFFNKEDPFNDYINLFSLINTKKLFDIVLGVLNISYEDQIKIKNTLGPTKNVFNWI